MFVLYNHFMKASNEAYFLALDQDTGTVHVIKD